MKPQIIGLLALGISNLVGADPAVIPHAFSADTAAKAEEVNANFSSLKTSIDDNDTRIYSNTGSISNVSAATAANASAMTQNSTDISANRQSIDQNTNAIGVNTSDIAQNTANIAANASDVLTNSLDISDITTDLGANTAAIAGLASIYVKANGQPIGLFIGSSPTSSAHGYSPYRVLSDTDYIFHLDVDGKLGEHQLSYSLPDCSGEAYADLNVDQARQGYVFKSKDPTDLVEAYYVASHTPTEAVLVASIRNDQGCSNVSSSRGDQPVFPNDPAITGVPNGLFATPITIGR